MNRCARFAVWCGVLAAGLAAGPVNAQNYPAKPVRVIVPHPAGTVVDTVSRGITQALSQALGQPFVIDNRGGADGIIGAEVCSKAAPDGYTLCSTSSLVITVNPVIRSKLTYDPPRELTPVVQYGVLSSAVVVQPSLPVSTMVELINLAKSKPGSIAWGSWGLSSLSHIYIEWLKNARGVAFYNVPYKSAAQAVQANLAGEIQVSVLAAGPAVSQEKAGKLKIRATNGETRSSWAPNVPSFKEAGIDVFIQTWFGMLAPAGTASEIVQRVNGVVSKSLSDSRFRDKFITAQGLEVVAPVSGGSPGQFAAFLKAEREMYEKVVRLAGIRRD